MIGQLGVICGCALGALLACGGEASQKDAMAGSGSDSGAAAAMSSGSGAGGDNAASAGRGGTATAENAGSSALGGAGGPAMSDPGSGTCTAFTPCGGALAGTWRVDSICLSPPVLVPLASCAMAHAELSASGSLIFAADGTVDVSQVRLEPSTVLPPSCITDPAACMALTSTLGSCSSTPDGGCKCIPRGVTTTPHMETYVISGNSVTITAVDEAPSTAYYCITGTQLLLRGWVTSTSSSSLENTYVYSMTRQ